jgi:thiol-disulfide isomerase/thioredoxin
VVFLESKENKLYQQYRKEIPMIQEELDALQLAYLKLDTDKDKKKLQKTYTKSLATYRGKLGALKKDSEGTLANYYMALDAKKYPDAIAEDPAAYLEVLKEGYFNGVDFQDERLVSTPLILDKIDNYVIYFNASDDITTAHDFQQKATEEVLQKIGGNVFLKEQALTSLLYNYVDAEDIVMTDFLMEKYRSLPNGILDNKVVADVNTKMKMAPGRMAPDFSFEENKELTNLYQLDEHEYYMIVFWSTACSHCVKEIPLVYNMVKEKESLKVIAVALELDELGFYDMTPKFPAFTNVLALNKWDNEIPRKYDVHATPSYFLLDKNKRIIVKPENEQQIAKALEVLQVK